MKAIDKIENHGNQTGYRVTRLESEMILVKKKDGTKLDIRWTERNGSLIFSVRSTMKNHWKFGNTKLLRRDLTLPDVITIINNPRVHNRKGVYEENERLRQKEALMRSKKIMRKPVQKGPPKKNSTGEKGVMLEIWNERVGPDGKHRSEISGSPLIENKNHPLFFNQFLHVLPKSNYPNFRLRKDNIMLGTWEEHDKQTRRVGECKADAKWDGFFARYAALFQEYEEMRKNGEFKFRK